MNAHPSPSRSAVPPEAYWLGRWFTSARREGLLALLAPEVWHTLSAILSFTSREGRRDFTLDQLAVALGQSREQARSRLETLTAIDWQGQPLATLERDREGEIAGAVLAPLEALAGARAPQPEPPSAADAAPVPAASDATPASQAPKAALAAELAAVGLDPDQIDGVLTGFPQERIRRQLDWLPARQARNPAALLIRAIEQNWSAPREVG